MSFTDQLAKIAKAKAEIAQAEAKFAADRVSALSRLPADYGYDSLNDFIKALKDAASKGGARGRKAKPTNAAKASKAAKPAKRTRAKITPELKQDVIAAVQAGKSGAEIAASFGISMPSVQNIKKEAGLVKSRGTGASQASAAPSSDAPAV